MTRVHFFFTFLLRKFKAEFSFGIYDNGKSMTGSLKCMISIINGIEQMSMKDIVQKYSFPEGILVQEPEEFLKFRSADLILIFW